MWAYLAVWVVVLVHARLEREGLPFLIFLPFLVFSDQIFFSLVSCGLRSVACFQAAVLLLSAVVSFFDVCGQAHLLAVVVRRACALDWVVSLASSLSGVCLGSCCRHCSLVFLGGLVLLDLIFLSVDLVAFCL